MIGLRGVGYIAVDPEENVYVADIDANRIVKLTAGGAVAAAWGQTGDGPGQFDAVNGVAVDAEGNVYATDEIGGRVQKFSREGAVLAGWGARGSGPGQFQRPQGLAVSRRGIIYVADTHNSRVQALSVDGQPLSAWGELRAGAVDRGAPGRLDLPADVAVDDRGDVYVADTRNARIQKFTADGHLLGVWKGDFRCPEGIAIGPEGDVFVADSGARNRIVKLTPSGTWFTVWSIPDFLNAAGDFIQGVAVGRQGNVYVTGYGRGSQPLVVCLSSSGEVEDVWT